MQRLYHQDISACLADAIGAGGLRPEELQALLNLLAPALDRVRQAHANNLWPFLRLPAARADLERLDPVARHYRARFSDVIILGTGGSSLGGKALYRMARPKAPHDSGAGPTLHIVTNIDPFSFDALRHRLDPAATGVVVISKSGGTLETLMQFLSILPGFRQALGDEALPAHITLITEPGDSPLRRLGARFGLPVLDHDPDIGGRYAVLSLVGMLPAMIAGLDPVMIRQGAEEVLRQTLEAAEPAQSPPALGAAAAVGLNQNRRVSSAVMLAYSDRLGSLARWHRQLWAESLGKQGRGMTPIYGTGPVDQHSQLQLWLDGPGDKMFTVLGERAREDGAPVINPLEGDPDLDFMAGRTLNNLMEASRRATAESLRAAGRPVRTLLLGKADAQSMGALMMHFMLETVFAASLLQVDPFSQPAVEHGKRLARRYLAEKDAWESSDGCPSR